MKSLLKNNGQSTQCKKKIYEQSATCLWYILSLLLITLWSCSDSEVFTRTSANDTQVEEQLILTDKERDMLRYVDTNFTFAEQEARRQAIDIAREFDAVDGQTRSVKEVVVINTPFKELEAKGFYKKLDATPELYVYNFTPAGFVVLGADERSLGDMILLPLMLQWIAPHMQAT